VQHICRGLPARRRFGRVFIPFVVIACIIAATTSCSSRDEGSYIYGRTTMSGDARILWRTTQEIPGSSIDSVEEACRVTVDTAVDVDTPQAASMKKMDLDDMVDGCVDVLAKEQKLGYLP
jgi:hypothetical protein